MVKTPEPKPAPRLGAAEMQRVRNAFNLRGNALDEIAVSKGGPTNADEAMQLARNFEDHFEIMICSTPSTDLTDALATTICAAQLYEGINSHEAHEPTSWEVERDAAIENAFFVIAEALIKHGADASIIGNEHTRKKWVQPRMDKIALAHGKYQGPSLDAGKGAEQ